MNRYLPLNKKIFLQMIPWVFPNPKLIERLIQLNPEFIEFNQNDPKERNLVIENRSQHEKNAFYHIIVDHVLSYSSDDRKKNYSIYLYMQDLQKAFHQKDSHITISPEWSLIKYSGFGYELYDFSRRPKGGNEFGVGVIVNLQTGKMFDLFLNDDGDIISIQKFYIDIVEVYEEIRNLNRFHKIYKRD